jgi:hypothetical protein
MPTPVASLGNVVVKQSSVVAGLGVFAGKDFSRGELIELCPVLPLAPAAWQSSTSLFEHAVTVSLRPLKAVLPLGYGALYNHADSPNATWSVVSSAETMEVTAARDIALGEEIFIFYGPDFSKEQKESENRRSGP